jgi:GNAT superfamily N-acetyltransferase
VVVQSSITTHTALQRGLRLADRTGRGILYRYISPTDDLDIITEMLHDSYAPLAEQGLRFLASHQDSDTTRKRMSRGETILALDGDEIVGTITLKEASRTQGSAFYNRTDVAGFGQFAVRPSHQECGIGSMLLDLVEQRAREKGIAMLALDTSEHAARLIALYTSKGYSFVEYVRWPVVNYRSMIFAKPLKNDHRPDRPSTIDP